MVWYSKSPIHEFEFELANYKASLFLDFIQLQSASRPQLSKNRRWRNGHRSNSRCDFRSIDRPCRLRRLFSVLPRTLPSMRCIQRLHARTHARMHTRTRWLMQKWRWRHASVHGLTVKTVWVSRVINYFVLDFFPCYSTSFFHSRPDRLCNLQICWITDYPAHVCLAGERSWCVSAILPNSDRLYFWNVRNRLRWVSFVVVKTY